MFSDTFYQRMGRSSLEISGVLASLRLGSMKQLSSPEHNSGVQGHCVPGSLFTTHGFPGAGIRRHRHRDPTRNKASRDPSSKSVRTMTKEGGEDP